MIGVTLLGDALKTTRSLPRAQGMLRDFTRSQVVRYGLEEVTALFGSTWVDALTADRSRAVGLLGDWGQWTERPFSPGWLDGDR